MTCIKYKDPDAKHVEDTFIRDGEIYNEKTKWSIGKAWKMLHKQVFDSQGSLKRKIRELLGVDGERMIHTMELSAGGTATGDVEYELGYEEVFNKLDKGEFLLLNKIIQARRNIELWKHRKSVARSFIDDKSIGRVYDMESKKDVEAFKKLGMKVEGKKRYQIAVRKLSGTGIKAKGFDSKEDADQSADEVVKQILKDAEILNPGGTTQEQYEKWLKATEEANPEAFSILDKRADKYFKVFKRQLGFMRKAGLITQDQFNHMASVGDYSPRRYVKFFDPDVTFNNLAPIEQGSTGALVQDSALLMRDYIVKLHDRIARNDANITAVEVAKANPDNGIFELVDKDYETKPTEKVFKAWIKGEEVRFKMPLELGKEWGNYDSAMDAQTARTFGWLSGTTLLKASATGVNPEFALTNLPRDIFFALFRTNQFNNFMPFGIAQMVRQMKKVSKDVWHRGDRPIGTAMEYLEDGGMMEFLTAQGMPLEKRFGSNFSRPMKALKWAEKWASFLGQKTELWVRLAVRQQTLDNLSKGGKPITKEMRKEASWVARSYLDFAQGGKFVKAVDKYIPYLNAGILATRGMFETLAGGNAKGKQRAINSAIAMYKVAQFTTMYAGVMMVNLMFHPDEVDKTDDRKLANNLVLYPPGLTFEEANGQKSYGMLKLPLDQGQAGLAGMIMLMLTDFLKDTVGTEGDSPWHKLANARTEPYAEAIKNLVPFTSVVPPTLKAILAWNNVDTYGMKPIVKGAEFNDRSNEWTPFTHPALRMTAEALNKAYPELDGVIDNKPFSAERMKFVLHSFFVPSNTLVRLFSSLTEIAAESVMSDEDKAAYNDVQETKRKYFSQLPISRIFEVTGTDSISELNITEKTKLKEHDRYASIYNDVRLHLSHINRMENISKDNTNEQNKKIKDKINTVLKNTLLDIEEARKKGVISHREADRIRRQAVTAKDIKLTNGSMRNPRLWWSVNGERNPDTKAKMIYKVWLERDKQGRVELMEEFHSLKGVSNKQTKDALAEKLIMHDIREKKKNEGR